MASRIEIGHARNLTNFENLIVAVMSYGNNYVPYKASLELSQLEFIFTQAQQALTTLTDKRSEYKIRVNDRQTIFAQLRPLATRVMAALNNSDADNKLIEDAKSFHFKIQGRRINNKPKANEALSATAPIRHSVSQQSYTQLIQHFEGLLSLLRRAPAYHPSHNDLQITSLEQFKVQLAQKSRAVMNAASDLTDARNARDYIFYKGPNALVEIAANVKAEVKSTFGTNSPEFAKINKCLFRVIL